MKSHLRTYKKSQIAIDFIIVLSVAFILFLFVFSIAGKRDDVLEAWGARLYAKTQADKLASEINAVFLAGEGANRTVSFPGTLRDGTQYALAIYPGNRRVVIEYGQGSRKGSYAASVLTANISGALSDISRDIVLANQGGVIVG